MEVVAGPDYRPIPQGAPKPQQKGMRKMDPKITNCLTNFGAILGAILGPNDAIFAN